MYKKVKATKNNNLKKASVFAAMAVLASWGASAMMNSESGTASAMVIGVPSFYNGSWAPRNYGWGGSLFNNGFVRNPNLTDDDSKAHASMFERLYGALAQKCSLNFGNLQNSIASMGNYGAFKFLGPLLKWIGVNKGSDNFSLAAAFSFPQLLSQLGATGIGAKAFAIAKYLGVLVKVQEAEAKFLYLVRRLVELPQMKNSEKLDKLKELDDKENGKNIGDVIEMIGLKNINASGLNSEAKKLVDRSLALFFEGGGLQTDSAANVSLFDATLNALSNNQDKSGSSELNDLKSVLAVVLQINSNINKFIRQCATLRTLMNWSHAIQTLRDRISSRSGRLEDKVSDFIAILDKKTLYQMLGNGKVDSDGVTHRGLGCAGLLPAVLCGADISSMKEGLTGYVDSVFGDVRGKVVGAFSGGNPPEAIMSASEAARGRTFSGDDRELTYDLTDALKSIFDDEELVREALSTLFDKPREDAFAYGLQLIDFQNKASDEEKQQIRSLAEAYETNLNSDYKFVNSDGTIAKSEVTVNTGRDMSLFSELLGQPKTISAMVLAYVLIDDLSRASSEAYWSNSSAAAEPWINGSDMRSKIGKVCNDLKTAYNAYSDLSKKVDEIKKLKPDEKKKQQAVSKSEGFSQPIVLNGNDTINGSITVKPVYEFDAANNKKLVSLRVEGLDANVKKISPVLCPKTSEADSGSDSKDGKAKKNNNVDLPTVEVVNGVATVDMSSVHDTGLHELHIRSLEDNKLNFLFKCKFFNNSKGIKHSKKVKSTFSQPGTDSKVNTSDHTPVLYKNSDGSLTGQFKLKDGVDGSKILAVVFEQNKSPKLETDQIGVDYDPTTKMVTFTTSPGLATPSNIQIHFYKGQLSADCFIGKYEANQSDTTEISSDENKNTLSGALAKSGAKSSSSSDKSREIQEKTLLLKLPNFNNSMNSMFTIPYNYGFGTNYSSAHDYYKGREITISFVGGKDDKEVIDSCSVKLDKKVREEGDTGSSSWLFGGDKQYTIYRVTLPVPVLDGGCKLRITDIPSGVFGDRVSSLDSSEKISSKTESEKVISFNTVNKSDSSFFWGGFNNWF